MQETLVPLWLDCDPGHDDAFAILLAAYHPAIRLLGISTVFGNAPLHHTTHNARSILTAIAKNRHIPVYSGAHKASVRPAIHAPTAIHGKTGLDGTDLLPTPGPGLGSDSYPYPHPNSPPDQNSNPPTATLTAIAHALLATPPRSAWLVATGAATNIAAVLRAYPQLAQHLAGVSLMAGAVGGEFTDAPLGRTEGESEEEGRERVGNWSRWAEFNVLADPEAAAEVLAMGTGVGGNEGLRGRVVMVPLDVTHLVLGTEEVREMLLWGREREGKEKSRLRVMLVELLMFFAEKYRELFGIATGPPLHDPLAVAIALTGTGEHEIPFYDFDPRVASTATDVHERYEVKVITDGTAEDARTNDAQTGRTVVRLLPPGAEGVRIPRGLDIQRFWAVLEDCLSRADKAIARSLSEAE